MIGKRSACMHELYLDILVVRLLCLYSSHELWLNIRRADRLTRAVCWLSAPPFWVWIVNWLITHCTFGTLNSRNEDAYRFPCSRNPASQISLWLPSPLAVTLFISQCHAEQRKWMNTIRYFRSFIPAVRLLHWRPGRKGHRSPNGDPHTFSCNTIVVLLVKMFHDEPVRNVFPLDLTVQDHPVFMGRLGLQQHFP